MTADRVRLHGWFIRSQVQPARAAIIYFHGNSGNIGSLGWLGESLAAREFDVLLFDYRGYGRSEGQIRDEYDMYKDADAAYRYVISRAPAPIERIVLYGQSLGTAAATDLASREKCGALIVESGLSSASDMAQVMAPWLPRWLNRFGQNRFDSKGKLPRVHCPVLISHGGSDDVAPASQGLALFASANEPKRLILAPEAGHNMFGHGGDEYIDQVAAFIREAVSPPSASPTAARQ
jgi:pimeloyl-ACP methyl ester carboxylesterase